MLRDSRSYEAQIIDAVRSVNKDWALVYNGADETTGYMLLEDLVADVVEEEMLD